VHARIAEAATLAGDPERALREAQLAELSSPADQPPALRALLHRIRGYAYLQLGRSDQAANEFRESIDAARSGDALYELALSLRAQAKLTSVPLKDGEAEHLFKALQISGVTEAPNGPS
jgi:tetratricopeptide (TPR) repeat protein